VQALVVPVAPQLPLKGVPAFTRNTGGGCPPPGRLVVLKSAAAAAFAAALAVAAAPAALAGRPVPALFPWGQ